MNNFTEFFYDGLGRNVKIVETESGSVTSTKQFVWSRKHRVEERNASDAVTKLFFTDGEKIGGTNYFYSKDKLGSIRELTEDDGDVATRYSYEPFGKATRFEGSVASDFQFAGYYFHERSGLNLALRRAYNSDLARWLSRDPIEESGGVNLLAYVNNEPVSARDLTGTLGIVDMSGGFIDIIKLIIEWIIKCFKKPDPPQEPQDPQNGGEDGGDDPPDDDAGTPPGGRDPVTKNKPPDDPWKHVDDKAPDVEYNRKLIEKYKRDLERIRRGPSAPHPEFCG